MIKPLINKNEQFWGYPLFVIISSKIKVIVVDYRKTTKSRWDEPCNPVIGRLVRPSVAVRKNCETGGGFLVLAIIKI